MSLTNRKREKDDVKLVWVEPGAQQVIFELPLHEIFLVSNDRKAGWYWNWQRQPEPMLSPVHKYRQPGFVDQASFVVSVDLGGSTLKSETATLKVKAEEK